MYTSSKVIQVLTLFKFLYVQLGYTHRFSRRAKVKEVQLTIYHSLSVMCRAL